MDREDTRDRMSDSAYAWALNNLGQFRDILNGTLSDPSATVDYQPMVGALVWSDELPNVPEAKWETLRKVFCVLIYLRTNIILGEDISPQGARLLEELRRSAPSWCFNAPNRWSSARRKDYEDVRSRFFQDFDRWAKKRGSC